MPELESLVPNEQITAPLDIRASAEADIANRLIYFKVQEGALGLPKTVRMPWYMVKKANAAIQQIEVATETAFHKAALAAYAGEQERAALDAKIKEKR